MTHRGRLSVLTAGMTVAALLSPPAAQARPTCQSTPETSICQTNGSVAIVARPGTRVRPFGRPGLDWLLWD